MLNLVTWPRLSSHVTFLMWWRAPWCIGCALNKYRIDTVVGIFLYGWWRITFSVLFMNWQNDFHLICVNGNVYASNHNWKTTPNGIVYNLLSSRCQESSKQTAVYVWDDHAAFHMSVVDRRLLKRICIKFPLEGTASPMIKLQELYEGLLCIVGCQLYTCLQPAVHVSFFTSVLWPHYECPMIALQVFIGSYRSYSDSHTNDVWNSAKLSLDTRYRDASPSSQIWKPLLVLNFSQCVSSRYIFVYVTWNPWLFEQLRTLELGSSRVTNLPQSELEQ